MTIIIIIVASSLIALPDRLIFRRFISGVLSGACNNGLVCKGLLTNLQAVCLSRPFHEFIQSIEGRLSESDGTSKTIWEKQLCDTEFYPVRTFHDSYKLESSKLELTLPRAKRTFHVSVVSDETGFYLGRCRELPNAFTVARSIDELRERMAEVIDLILDD